MMQCLVERGPDNYGDLPRRRRRWQGRSVSRGRPSPSPTAVCGAWRDRVASVLAWGGQSVRFAFRQVPRSRPRRRGVRATRPFPGQFRPGPGCARCPSPARPRLRSVPVICAPGGAVRYRPEGRGASRGASAGPAERGCGASPMPRPRPVQRPHQGRAPSRAGPPRRGSGRRRMVFHQPRRRRFPAPATLLRRGCALPRRGAEFPLP
jgi:hypothetical protein